MKSLICLFSQPGSSESKLVVLETSNEKQDQPSPISVLESTFEDYNTAYESLQCMKSGHMGNAYSLPFKEALILYNLDLKLFANVNKKIFTRSINHNDQIIIMYGFIILYFYKVRYMIGYD